MAEIPNYVQMEIDGTKVDVLRVPYFPQTKYDYHCYVCSLKMVLSYFKNFFNNEFVRQNTPEMDFEKIISITNTSKLGTRKHDLVKKLEGEIKTLKFEVRKKVTFQDIEKAFKKMLPTIVIYDGSYIKNQERGGAHAGVVVGITGDKIVLNNPWHGYQFVADRIDFERAWELEYKTIITITPILQTTLSQQIGSPTLQTNFGGLSNA